jgi:bacterial/archaeal transporter family-2 protein
MNAGWIIPFIILGGALQSCGAAMNGQLNKHVVNPWLASAISFALTAPKEAIRDACFL